MKYIKIFILTMLFIPFYAFADPGDGFVAFMGVFQNILNDLIPIIISIAVVTFLYGIVKFIKSAEQPEEREEGKKIIAYGLLAIFVMVSMWGFVNIIVGTVLPSANDRLLDDVPQGVDGVW